MSARINIERDVEGQDEFWPLLAACDGNRFTALGMLVVLFRKAQKAFGKGESISRDELEKSGLEIMIKTGWVIPNETGFQVRNPEQHFGWYKQKIDAAKKGGRPKQNAKSNKKAEEKPGGLRNEPTENPLTLTPSLTHSDTSYLVLSAPQGLEVQEKFNPVTLWCDEYKKAHGHSPPITGKDAGTLSKWAKGKARDGVQLLFAAYLQMQDRLYQEQKHPLSLFFRDLNKIFAAAKSGVDPSGKRDPFAMVGKASGE